MPSSSTLGRRGRRARGRRASDSAGVGARPGTSGGTASPGSNGRGFPTRSYLAILGTAFLCYAALGSVVRILPAYVPSIGGGTVAVGLGVGAPALSAIFTRPLGGRWADRAGPRAVLLLGAGAMSLGAPIALVQNVPMLVLSRLVVGAGEGLMMSASALWLLRLGGPERRGRSIGHVGLANYGGLVAGPLLAVALAGEQHASRVFLLGIVLPPLGALLALLARPGAGAAHEAAASERAGLGQVLGWTFRPGLGLMLVNVGYAALVSFGALAIAANGAGGASLVLPVFAAVVILVRGLAGSVPDRFGPERTLWLACPAAAAGLLGVGLAPSATTALLSVAVLSAGQALAVPALGAIALRRSPSSQHGATAGLFFAWFDAGVGLGGPIAGLAAHLAQPPGALETAAVAVALTPLVSTLAPSRAGARPRARSGRAPAPSARAASGRSAREPTRGRRR
jgi:MFS family permease